MVRSVWFIHLITAVDQAEQHFQHALAVTQAKGNEADSELCSLQLQLISNMRQGNVLDQMSFNLKTKHKRLYPDSSFPEFLEDYNRQSAALTADMHRKNLESQLERYSDFVSENGESEIADATFLPMIGETAVKLGEAELNARNLETAREILWRALQIVDRCGMMKYIALTNYHLARVERSLQNTDIAEVYFTTACDIFRNLGARRELERIQQAWEQIDD